MHYLICFSDNMYHCIICYNSLQFHLIPLNSNLVMSKERRTEGQTDWRTWTKQYPSNFDGDNISNGY